MTVVSGEDDVNAKPAALVASGSGNSSSSEIQNYMDDCRNTIGFNEIRIGGKVCGQSFKWHITSIHFKMQI